MGNISANNSNQIGIANLSPTAVRNAGMNQIDDTATITMLSGSIGETDRIQNDVVGTLNMRSGTLNSGNSGEGTLEFVTGNISGGGIAFNWATHLKFGTLNLQPGAPNLTLNNGFLARQTVLEIGSGGLTLNGQSIRISSGGLNNYAGGGAVLRLGGGVTVNNDPLNGTSLAGQGIFNEIGSNMREFTNSYIDLMGGTRNFNVADGLAFAVSSLMKNGGYSKSGAGIMTVQPYAPKVFDGGLFDGPVAVNAGTLIIRSHEALGTALGGVTIASGGTLKIDGNVTAGDNFTISGPGANVTGTTDVKEIGALMVEQGQLRVTGTVALGANATIAAHGTALTGVAAAPIVRTYINLTDAAGITGTGTLTLSGIGDGTIAGGLNTISGGLIKEGSGRWEINGGGAYVGPTTIGAGVLRIGNGAALGSPASGTTVYGGATLELNGGISVPEPLTISGDGIGTQSGAIVNVGGTNTLSGAITLLGTTLRSDAGTLNVTGAVIGGATSLTLTGAGNGSISGAITVGAPPSGDVLTKNGKGTWTLSGGNSLNGSTGVNGGTLVLASAGSALDVLSPLNMGGGSVTVTGSAQTVNGLNLNAGGAAIGGGAGLSVGLITRTAGATASFSGSVTAGGTINTNGILGGYATVGNDWATVNGTSNIVAYAGYTDVSTATLPAATANGLTTVTLPIGLPSAGSVLNSLKIAGGSGVDLGANNLALGSGGLLHSSSIPGGITGTPSPTTALLSGATSSDELIVHVTGAPLDIATAIIARTTDVVGTGGLTKAGPGTLVLSGTSNFSGPININAGTLSIVGPGGTTHPTALGVGTGSRPINLNGGTFESVGGDFDPGNGTMVFVVGPNGGTIRSRLGSQITINDAVAAPQLSGSGDLTLTGGGRFVLSAGGATFPNFTGLVNLEQGILTVGTLTTLGGRTTQTLTLGAGTVFINNAGGSGNALGFANNIVANGAGIFPLGGDRTFMGDIQFSGTNTIGLIERDTVSQNRIVTLTGRLSGSGTIDIFGHNQGAAVGGQGNGTFVNISGTSNTFAGTINLKPNAGLEARVQGSLGATPGQVTVNLDTNSRFLLRAPASGDYMANVVINGDAVVSAANMAAGAGFGSGDRHQLAINNLTVNNGKVFSTVSGGNNYTLRVNGSATFTGDANIIAESNNIALVNGATFTGGSQSLNKYGGFGLFLFDASNHSGTTRINNGAIHLRGTAGALPNTSSIELRGSGATLFIDNGDGANANRINDAGTLVLGGGALRVNGTETSLGTVIAPSGMTIVSYTQASLTSTVPLALGTSFTRSVGAMLNFTSDNGTLGLSNTAQFRAQPAITIPGQADVPAGDIIPWAVGSNNEFIRYDSALGGVVQINNNQSGNNTASATYINDPTDANLLIGNIIRTTGTNTTTTLTTSRTVKAMKLDGGDPALNATARRLDLATFTLTVDRGLINHIAQTQNIGNSNTTTPATLTTANASGELFILSGGGTLDIGPGSYTTGDSTTTSGTATALGGSVVIADNGATPLILVKGGAGAVELRNTAAANTYTGGTIVNQGTLRTFRGNGLSTGTITMNGGSLEIHSEESNTTANDNLAGLGQNVVVNGNAQLLLDNGPGNAAANVDDNAIMGTLTINGPYVLGIGGSDGFDWSFTGAALTGSPIIDIGLGRTSASADLSTTTINGVVSGSGFRVIAGNTTANSIGTLQLTGAAANTYAGEVTVYDGTVQLNKTAGLDAITGDLTINGGTVSLLAADQINDASNVVLNRGTLNFGGFAETMNTITMNGGLITTGATAVLNVTSDVTLRGTNNADGLQINSGAAVTVGGTLRILDYGKAVLGGAAGTITSLTVGGLQMDGSIIRMNADATTNGNQLVLLGDVQTLPNAATAQVGNVDGAADDPQTFINLNGARTFNVADGPAGNDLLLKAALRDNGATPGGLVKNGGGVVLFQGGGSANTYSGATVVNDGALVLHKSAGTTALGNGSATNSLTIGDSAGAGRSAQVIVRNSNQIADATAVTLRSDGLLDLDTFNTSETIGNLSGAAGAEITLGPTSTLTATSSSATTFSGNIGGGGILTKAGAGELTLDGELSVWTINASAGTLNLDTDGNNAILNVSNAGTGVNIGVSQTLTALNIGDGTTVVMDAVPPAPSEGFGDGFAAIVADSSLGAGFGGDGSGLAVVPEPGSVALLVFGALGLLGRRRRS